MSQENFRGFLNKVTSKVKSKEAHSMIKNELSNHINQLSESFQKSNLTKEEAEEKAIREMGNPYTLGENLNRIHKPKMDWLLIGLFIVIASISFLPIINGVPELPNSGNHFLNQKIIGYFLSILIIGTFLFFDYRKIKNYWIGFYGIGLILFIYTSLFGLISLSAKNWVSLFGITIDVGTATLFFFFLAWAGIFSRINAFNTWIKKMLLSFLFWTPILFYIMIPNLGVMMIYFFCIVMLFAFSKAQKKLAIQLVILNLVVFILIFSLYFSTFLGTERMNRLTAFMNPNADPFDSGYIYLKLQDIFSRAGWFGNGLDRVPPLPSAHTDFAFPFLVYTFGWAFGIVLCITLLTFILRISMNTFKTKDQYGRLLVIGGATLFTVPTLWNILMGLGMLPITGVSIPFISYGNTTLVVYSAILGLILSIYRRKDLVEPTVPNLR
ncbi:FtsW/RodA/SpoVE family cell cycle protein [Ornithinibacillus californiensis]|uniref:FtsW/RodA/SpoVE family cell cycle protein n=1 Tax=Ornithinibacillus californiensis TaxID=161536 RepID=UPI00064DC299|nr:FtsW/RodA/SpoVE family cell cycle protein [Ornithinibacillus californiensis]